MTNTLHRYGDERSLRNDFIVFAIPCRGHNDQDSVPKLREFLRMAVKHDPVNIGDGSKGGMYRPNKSLLTGRATRSPILRKWSRRFPTPRRSRLSLTTKRQSRTSFRSCGRRILGCRSTLVPPSKTLKPAATTSICPVTAWNTRWASLERRTVSLTGRYWNCLRCADMA